MFLEVSTHDLSARLGLWGSIMVGDAVDIAAYLLETREIKEKEQDRGIPVPAWTRPRVTGRSQ